MIRLRALGLLSCNWILPEVGPDVGPGKLQLQRKDPHVAPHANRSSVRTSTCRNKLALDLSSAQRSSASCAARRGLGAGTPLVRDPSAALPSGVQRSQRGVVSRLSRPGGALTSLGLTRRRRPRRRRRAAAGVVPGRLVDPGARGLRRPLRSGLARPRSGRLRVSA